MSILSNGGDGCAFDWILELDQWVGRVVHVSWRCLAVGAEIGIMANSALVANASDVACLPFVHAKWAITVDAVVNF